jgi:(p)ppGpp synthase/HD superfamily hydrolase
MRKKPKKGKITKQEKQLNKAIAIAAHIHRGQVRKKPDGRPYICHVLDVVNSFEDTKHLERMVAALHDTVEDSPKGKRKALKAKIKQLFGPKVLAGVEAMTHLKKKGRTEDEELADYLDYVKSCVSKNKAAIPVKIIDNYVNMKDRVTQFVAGGKDAENARKKLHQYASSIALLTKKKEKTAK